ncbi:MAG: MFS transporter [Spirochaetes bacterium]|nr:MFS transporter [Spirochaetota bacterium]
MSDNSMYNNAKTWQIGFFSLNNAATNLHFNLFSLYFLVYCTEFWKLNPVLVGTIMMLSRLLDAFTDPAIGYFIDKTETRFGKFRPYMVLGSLIINISLVAMFWGVKFDSRIAVLAWLTIWYFIWVVGYTFQTIITKAGQVVLSNNPSQRPIFVGFDGFFSMAVFILISAGINPVLLHFGGTEDPAGWRFVAFTVILLNTVFTVLAVIGLSKKDRKEYFIENRETKRVRIMDFIPVIKKNRALQMLIVSASTNKLANVTLNASIVYFFMYVMQNLRLQSTIMPIIGLCGVAGAFLAMGIAMKTSNRTSFVFGTWMSIVSIAVILVFRPFSPGLVPIAIVLFGFMSFFNGIANNIILVMIPDTADYETWSNGKFIPGMISTTFSFVDKAVSALGGLLVGIALSGYTSGMEVTPRLYWSILFVFLGVPLLGHIASAIAMKWYPITREFYNKMIREINERKNVGTAAATESD